MLLGSGCCMPRGTFKFVRTRNKTVKVHLLVDVGSGWEVLWITTDVDRILRLVNANPIYLHGRRKGECREIGGFEVWRYPQIGNQILWHAFS